MAFIDECIDRVIEREGGYVWHPKDRGGPTNYGITLKILSQWRGGIVVRAWDVKHLSRDEAHVIYKDMFWMHPRYDEMGLSDEVMELIFDSAVHHGVPRANRLLQRAVGVTVDGIVGPVTIAAARDMPQADLMKLYAAERAHYFGRIITRLPVQAAFAAGWMKRMAEFIRKIPT